MIRRLWFAQSSDPAGTGVLVSSTIGPVKPWVPSPNPYPIFVLPRKAKGLSEILVIEVGTKTMAVTVAVTVLWL